MNQELSSHQLEPLLIACVEDDCGRLQSQRLDALLGEDTAALAAYIDMMSMHAILQWRFELRPDKTALDESSVASQAFRKIPQEGDNFPDIAVNTPPQAIAPLAIDGPAGFPSLSTTIHGMVGYFSSGWPVAYLMATVIFGIGLLIGSHVYVSEPVPIVRQPAPLPSPLSPFPSVVGRITGMVDCQFEEGSGAENQKSEIRDQKSIVALGDKFALSSGLMEITYDTGAKVILQGPVTYEVESPAGGYLSIGKLFARVESAKSQAANQKSEIQNHKLFVVRTPTVTVTDLGTEFGVNVSQDGASEIHVLKGLVRTQTSRRRAEDRRRSNCGKVRRGGIGPPPSQPTIVSWPRQTRFRSIG